MNFIENESKQKLRGGYYTPIDLAQYITRWVIQPNTGDCLEPSCGDGIFIEALQTVAKRSAPSVTAIEIEPSEAAKSRRRLQATSRIKGSVLNRDFLEWAIARLVKKDATFGAALGNPPFIRYQYLPEEAQARAEKLFKLLGLPFTKHTNAWVPFVLASIALLRPGGRIGMILPAEIIHIAHAQALRAYFAAHCSKILVIDPEELWFEDTLQGAVIVFAEKKLNKDDRSYGVNITRVKGKSFLSIDPNELFNTAHFINGETVRGKWTRALLNDSERDLIDNLRMRSNVHSFETVASVDVGIVTGANKFFLVPDEIVDRYGLLKYAHPMFGRSDHCPGVIYDAAQHRDNARNGLPTNFLWIKGDRSTLSKKVQKYLETGETQSLPTRYKCRTRSPWYTVPSVYSTSVGMLKRASDTPRLILNRLEAYTTDTAYRITPLVPAEKLVYCFMNSLTAVCCELEGRHYGGGVLELVPSEIERVLIPLPASLRANVRQLDRDVRSLPTAELLSQQDDKVLEAIGMSKNDRKTLLSTWLRLKNRRQRISVESVD
jgi:adenine-specific DNA methylase